MALIQKSLIPLDWNPNTGFNEWAAYIHGEVQKMASANLPVAGESVVTSYNQPLADDLVQMARLRNEALTLIYK